jgi:hypothetical protein
MQLSQSLALPLLSCHGTDRDGHTVTVYVRLSSYTGCQRSHKMVHRCAEVTLVVFSSTGLYTNTWVDDNNRTSAP